MTPRAYLQMLWRALKSLYRNHGPRHGAAIAYYTLFALAPVLLVVVAVAGLVFGQEAVRGELVAQISGLIGEEGGRAVQAILQRASEPREGIGATVVGTIGLLLATTGAFLEPVLFRVLPDVDLGWRDVIIGALTTAVLFAIGQRLIGLYLGRSAIASPFGAAGTIAVILVWVYYATQIVLLGAEFTYQHARIRRPSPEPVPGAVRDPLPAA